MGIFSKTCDISMAGPAVIFIRDENVNQTCGYLLCNLFQVHQRSRSRRELHLQGISVEVMIALKRLNDEIV